METSQHRALAVATYHQCWQLLETLHRSSDMDRDLLTAAFTSRYHWALVGEAEQWIVADWMVARVCAALGEGRLSLSFAQRAHDVALSTSSADWLVASTAEGLVRAYAAAGMVVEREDWRDRAGELVAAIGNDEDRALIASQLASVPR